MQRAVTAVILAGLVVGTVVALPPAVSNAQDLHPSRRPSPMGMARTTLDDNYLRVVYSRPYKRGRDNIFGTKDSEALVPFGERWRTGANEATEITFTGDVMVGDQRLPAGTYSLFTTPGPESWKIHFNSTLGLSGTGYFYPDEGRFEPAELEPTDLLVTTIAAGTLEEEVDQFTIVFEPSDQGTEMCLRWITTEIRVPISLPSH